MAINDIASATKALLAAEATRTERTRITDEWTDLDLETGYKIQRAFVDAKVAAGDKVIGTKLGLTSRAKQEVAHRRP